jgi:uncharacterized protein YdhG (YjbR/CyaY superfamily)
MQRLIFVVSEEQKKKKRKSQMEVKEQNKVFQTAIQKGDWKSVTSFLNEKQIILTIDHFNLIPDKDAALACFKFWFDDDNLSSEIINKEFLKVFEKSKYVKEWQQIVRKMRDARTPEQADDVEITSSWTVVSSVFRERWRQSAERVAELDSSLSLLEAELSLREESEGTLDIEEKAELTKSRSQLDQLLGELKKTGLGRGPEKRKQETEELKAIIKESQKNTKEQIEAWWALRSFGKISLACKKITDKEEITKLLEHFSKWGFWYSLPSTWDTVKVGVFISSNPFLKELPIYTEQLEKFLHWKSMYGKDEWKKWTVEQERIKQTRVQEALPSLQEKFSANLEVFKNNFWIAFGETFGEKWTAEQLAKFVEVNPWIQGKHIELSPFEMENWKENSVDPKWKTWVFHGIKSLYK